MLKLEFLKSDYKKTTSEKILKKFSSIRDALINNISKNGDKINIRKKLREPP